VYILQEGFNYNMQYTHNNNNKSQVNPFELIVLPTTHAQYVWCFQHSYFWQRI